MREALGRVRSPYLVECRYLPDELYDWFDLAGQGSYRSVMLMEWADGEPWAVPWPVCAERATARDSGRWPGASTVWDCGCWRPISRMAI